MASLRPPSGLHGVIPAWQLGGCASHCRRAGTHPFMLCKGGAMTAKRGWALIQISKPSDALSSVLSYYLGRGGGGGWQVLFHWLRRMGNPWKGLLGCWGSSRDVGSCHPNRLACFE